MLKTLIVSLLIVVSLSVASNKEIWSDGPCYKAYSFYIWNWSNGSLICEGSSTCSARMLYICCSNGADGWDKDLAVLEHTIFNYTDCDGNDSYTKCQVGTLGYCSDGTYSHPSSTISTKCTNGDTCLAV